MSTNRMPIFPSRANHILMKQRLAAARLGLNLLKKKKDAIEKKLRQISAEMLVKKKVADTAMHEAIFSMARGNYLGTDFKPAAVANMEKTDIQLEVADAKMFGISLPCFELHMKPPAALPLTGLATGGEHVRTIRKKFQEALQELISLASLKYNYKELERNERTNNMRVNGLECVVIPRYIETVDYICLELDEMGREEFYRLKCSQRKQRLLRERQAQTTQGVNEASGNKSAIRDYALNIPFEMEQFDQPEPEEVQIPVETSSQAALATTTPQAEGVEQEQEEAEEEEESSAALPPSEPPPPAFDDYDEFE